MKKCAHLMLVTAAACGLSSTSLAGVVPTFASWADAGSGSLNGVNFTVAKSGGGTLNNSYVGSAEFNTIYWDDTGDQQYLEYSNGQDFTITFDSAISSLSLYTYYWRGSETGGTDVYTLSESFTANATFSGTVVGDTLTGSEWNNGILSFSGPVTTLTITLGAAPSTPGNYQGFTMAQPAGSQAVPGIGGLAAIAGVGLIGRRRRR